MFEERLKSKIHQLIVTDANKEYKGSISLGPELMRSAGLYEYDAVLVNSIDTGFSWKTYVIPGEEGEVTMNGAAANHFDIGERIHVIQYAYFRPNPFMFEYNIGERISNRKPHKPRIVHCDENNKVISND